MHAGDDGCIEQNRGSVTAVGKGEGYTPLATVTLTGR